jgi:formylglycine-generating enzyme required for sulfatase activity
MNRTRALIFLLATLASNPVDGGNVLEWCLDYWHESYNGAPADGSAWVRGGDTQSRVLRSGAWNDIAYQCRSAYRDKITPSYWAGGFRVVGVARRR